MDVFSTIVERHTFIAVRSSMQIYGNVLVEILPLFQ